MSKTLSLLLSALALALLAFFCVWRGAPRIEAKVAACTTASLAGAGYGWATVDIDGRDVRLVGTAPSEEMRSSAVSLARGGCGVRVVDDGLSLAAVAEPEAAEPEVAVTPPPDTGAECRRLLSEALAADEIHFAFDRADLPPGARPYLDRIAGIAADCPRARLDLRGNTDAQGSDAYNVELSRRRVAAVRAHLESAGLAADRFQTEALGESEPVATNQTAEGRAANRRVDIRLIGGQ